MSSGLFYNISTDSQVQMSLPRDANGNLFPSSVATGESFIWVEETSGMTFQLQESM